MANQQIKNVGVVGAGAMGAQIAVVAALHGYPVVLQDISSESLEKAEGILRTQLEKRVTKGKFTREQVDEAFAHLVFTTKLEDLSDADIVIEAIIENLDAKTALYAKLDDILPSHAILATNSSTIVSSKLADAVTRKDKVCNIHFFNPVLVMDLVEVVKGPHTSDETADTSMEFIKTIGKTPVLLKKEISGFVANRILARLMDEAIYLYENGYATYEEIDIVVTKALGHPIGPFALMDLTGLDVNYAVRKQRYSESGDERDKPTKSVEEKVQKGELGRKTGKGWYEYDENGKRIQGETIQQ
ncbi:3-hydroxyacyl-CoA dehydrogenase family protein [Cytobacillus purgationiresistens]|uniref:3-hydroxybutyryl-CoA dehydrogenase n=1 Tax=Cytobacillus purgationiresistens TaxID=863449 RepID=A0ABU0AGN1_9BACI|nr:3-hydroxyacyl-CoA dehydrogenase family protein [Cytobacillus purgationiresistens]MDQ0270415.1 3-hydroxybutyryl-CoA dehydrogenase [Cytobacillus purgationiresistens]